METRTASSKGTYYVDLFATYIVLDGSFQTTQVRDLPRNNCEKEFLVANSLLYLVVGLLEVTLSHVGISHNRAWVPVRGFCTAVSRLLVHPMRCPELLQPRQFSKCTSVQCSYVPRKTNKAISSHSSRICTNAANTPFTSLNTNHKQLFGALLLLC